MPGAGRRGAGPARVTRQQPSSVSVRAARAGAERSERRRTHSRWHRRAHTRGHRAPSTHAHRQARREAERGAAGRTLARSRLCQLPVGFCSLSQDTGGCARSHPKHTGACADAWQKRSPAHTCRTHTGTCIRTGLVEVAVVPSAPSTHLPNGIRKHTFGSDEELRAQPSPFPTSTELTATLLGVWGQVADMLGGHVHPRWSKVIVGTVCSHFLSGHIQAHTLCNPESVPHLVGGGPCLPPLPMGTGWVKTLNTGCGQERVLGRRPLPSK